MKKPANASSHASTLPPRNPSRPWDTSSTSCCAEERPHPLRPSMDLVPTPSQTAGPFFHLGFSRTFDGVIASPDAKGERVHLVCRVIDGDGVPLPDAMIELWQANSEGKYHSADDPQAKPLDRNYVGFRGFGRLATTQDGTCIFETIKPGRVPGFSDTPQAPHINVSIFARGILKPLATRI